GLAVTGSTSLNGPATVSGTLGVTGALSAGSNASVTGSLTAGTLAASAAANNPSLRLSGADFRYSSVQNSLELYNAGLGIWERVGAMRHVGGPPVVGVVPDGALQRQDRPFFQSGQVLVNTGALGVSGNIPFPEEDVNGVWAVIPALRYEASLVDARAD